MARGIVKTGVDTAGGIIRPQQDYVTIEGAPVGEVGCPVDAHDPCWVPIVVHCNAVMAEGAPDITIDGVAVCFEDHEASCGHLATGRDWITMEGF